MMRRVRKEEVQPVAAQPQDGLTVCLGCWKYWMGKDDRDLGASRMMLRTDRDREAIGYDRDVYEEQRVADLRVGEATGAMIEDLKAAHRWAIYRSCGITTQWQFPQLRWETVALQAMDELEKKLRRNIATATLF